MFLVKLYRVVADRANHKIVTWGPGDSGIMIVDKKRFENEIIKNNFNNIKF